MKLHVIVAGLLMVLAFVAGRLSKEQVNLAQAQAEAGGAGAGVPVGNGDVNGVGGIDVTDATYLLGWLFLGTDSPVPILRVAATGQTKCYDDDGAEIDCANANFPGQDGFYQAGCPSEGRFVDNGDGTVTDNCTGLMWQKETADVSGDGTIWDEDRLSWQDALKYCEGLDSAGHTDWRLPNVRELQSIVDYGRFLPAVDPVFRAESGWYWSSSSGVAGAGVAWYVGFYDGYVGIIGQYSGEFVRPVRGGLGH